MNKCLKYQPRRRILFTQVSARFKGIPGESNWNVLLGSKQLSRCYAAAQPPPPAGPEKVAPATVGLAHKPDPQAVKCDYIGPPDPQSNLRPYVRHHDENETPLARSLRLKRTEVEAWNVDFWTRHNKRFYEVSGTYAASC